MDSPQIKPLGDCGLVIEFPDEISPATNGRVRALGRLFESVAGVLETVPTLRSLLLVLDPLIANRDEIMEYASRLALTVSPDMLGTGRLHEVPVVYGGSTGPDLEKVADVHGLTVDGVVRMHCEADYIVYMLGFAPGFAYLGVLPPMLHTPRRPSPRVRVPAGSVAVAESLTGIYPLQTPGGWQLIGRTPKRIYDPQASDPVLFRPGDRVRFVPVAGAEFPAEVIRPASGNAPAFPVLEVLDPGLYSTVQDRGRARYRSLGVPLSGAMDPLALQVVNLITGNAPNAPALECTAPGPILRVLGETTLVIGGADLSATLDRTSIDLWSPLAVRRGQTIQFGAPRRGMWAYVAVAGGLDIAPAMGSASTYVPGTLGGVEGRRLIAGDVLGRREGASRSRALRHEIATLPVDHVRVRVIAGPQEEFFTEVGRTTFVDKAYHVSVHSNRAGIRLEGPPITHRDRADILSDGLLPGAVQIPAGGQPIVIGPDGPTTGGYPKIGVLASTDQRLLAQSRPGTAVRFEVTTLEAAIEARRAEHAILQDWLQGS